MNIQSLLINQKESKKNFLENAKKAVGIALLASALILAMQLFLALVVVGFMLSFFNTLSSTTLGNLFIDAFIYLFSILSALLVAKLLFKKFLPKANYDFPKRKAPKKPWLYICGSIGTGYIVNILINFCFPKFVERFSTETHVSAETPIEIFCTYILFAFLPAIFEELIFRGVLFKHLLPYGKHGAIIITSILFGLVHIDPPRVIFATVFGILLAYCCEYTGSIVIPMVIHFINNAISVTATLSIDNIPISFLLSLLIIVLAGCGIFAIIFYSTNGIKNHKVSLNKPFCIGHKIRVSEFLRVFVFNYAFLPFLIVYLFIFITNY